MKLQINLLIIFMFFSSQVSACFQSGLQIDYLDMEFNIPQSFKLIAPRAFKEGKLVFSVDSTKHKECGFAQLVIERLSNSEALDELVAGGGAEKLEPKCGIGIYRMNMPKRDDAVVNIESVIYTLRSLSVQVTSSDSRYGQVLINNLCGSIK